MHVAGSVGLTTKCVLSLLCPPRNLTNTILAAIMLRYV